MSILALIFFLSIITMPDSPAITQDNQNSNGIIINQDLTNDAQTNYDNGILIVKDSVNQDSEVTPAQTSSSSSSSSGGGGGGGGGVTSSENFSNILQFEQHDGILIKDTPVSFKFNLLIYEILLTGKENEYDVSVRVELLKDKPSKATIKPEGEVIQYFNVVTSTKRMKEAVIRFKTNRSVKAFGIFKLINSTWMPISYSYYVNNSYYEIKTDSFSSFIVVEGASQPENTILESVIVDAEKVYPSSTIPTQSSIPKQASGFTVILTIFVLLIIRRIK